MKKALIVLVIILLVAAVILGFALYNANSLVGAFRPEVERLVSSVLKTPVSFGKVNASVFPKTEFRAVDIKLGKEAEALSLQALAFEVDLFALLSKSLSIQNLVVEGPKLTFVRSPSGTSLKGAPKKSATAIPVRKELTPAKPAQPSTFKMNLKRLEISQATFVIEDQVDNVTYEWANVNLDASADFNGDALKISNSKVTFPGGSGELNGELVTSKGTGAFTFSTSKHLQETLKFLEANSKLKELAPTGDVNFAGEASFGSNAYNAKVDAQLQDVGLKVGPLAIGNLVSSIKITADKNEQAVSSDQFKFAVAGQEISLAFNVRMSGNKITANVPALQAFGGQLKLDSALDNKSKLFNLNWSGGAFQISELMALSTMSPETRPSGVIQTCEGKLAGSLGADLKASITGDTNVAIKDAKLPGVNLAAEVLKSVRGLPFLGDALIAHVPQQYRGEIESPNTAFSSISATFQIKDQRISSNNIRAESALFNLGAAGTIGFDAEIDLQASVEFAPQISAGIVGKVKELKALLDQSGRLVIPVQIQGKAPSLRVLPDLDRILKSTAGQLVKQKAGEVLNKLFNKGGNKQGKQGGLGGVLGF